jgi:hypothetical protein
VKRHYHRWGMHPSGRSLSRLGSVDSGTATGSASSSLVPFVVMFVLHEPLGMTDTFLMGDRVSADYNLMTFASLFLGSDVVLQGTRSGHPSVPLGQILSKLRRHGLGTNYPVSGSGPRSIRSPASRRVRERQCVAV